MADEHDLSLRSEDKAFLLGGDLMVIPRWADKVSEPGKGAWKAFTLETNPDRYQALLKQRPGSVIPLANLAQSTDEMRTDSLTLLVCLDNEGKALGQLYEDAGDGFDYRNGDYLVTSLKASLQKRQLTVSLSAVEGKRTAVPRFLRIAYVTDGGVRYSSWQTGDRATMKIRK
jgi:alpha-glucosidase